MLFPAKSSGVVWIIRRRALCAKRYQELRETVLYLSLTLRSLKVADQYPVIVISYDGRPVNYSPQTRNTGGGNEDKEDTQ